MDINRRDSHAWFNRGKILASFGKYEQALTCYNNALALKISYYEAWCEKGVVLEELGYWQEAEVCFNESLGIFCDECLEENLTDNELFSIPGEDNESIYYNKACFYALEGNREKAFDNLRNALALNPDKYLEMIPYDPDLDVLKQDPMLIELVQNQEKLMIKSIPC